MTRPHDQEYYRKKYRPDRVGVGLEAVRQRPGYHDEPLKGQRLGQRSVRLNRAYRAIYVEHDDAKVRLFEVIEVNKHDY